MSLSCGCDDPGAPYWWYSCGDNFEPISHYRPARCKSCKAPLHFGALVLEIQRWRPVRDEIEIKIHGEDGEILLATWYLCERCGGIYASLEDLGFCVDPGSNMEESLAEYHRDYAKLPKGAQM